MRQFSKRLYFLLFSFSAIVISFGENLAEKALNGDNTAQIRLALQAISKTPPLWQEARNWLEMAAHAGNSDACYWLGLFEIKGWGKPTNIDRATYWWNRGASLGNMKCFEEMISHFSQENKRTEEIAWLELLMEIDPSHPLAQKLSALNTTDPNILDKIAPKKESIRSAWVIQKNSHTQSIKTTKKSKKIDLSNNLIFEGIVNGDYPDGYGRLRKKEGDTFYGNFKNGKPDGFGTLIDRDGSILQATWNKGVPKQIIYQNKK